MGGGGGGGGAGGGGGGGGCWLVGWVFKLNVKNIHHYVSTH